MVAQYEQRWTAWPWPADEVALVLARAKAEVVAARVADALVLGCDSVLELDGEVHGKPADAAEATARWRRMRGREGVLHTGHWLVDLRDARTARARRSARSRLDRRPVRRRQRRRDRGVRRRPASRCGVAGAFTIDGLGGRVRRGRGRRPAHRRRPEPAAAAAAARRGRRVLARLWAPAVEVGSTAVSSVDSPRCRPGLRLGTPYLALRRRPGPGKACRAPHVRDRPPRGPRGRPDRRDHRRVPGPAEPPRRAAPGLDRRARRPWPSASGIAVALQLLERALPQREQEMLETVIGALAVVMVTAMIVWMRHHARAMKGELEGGGRRGPGPRLGPGAGPDGVPGRPARGFRDAVFLLATFQASGNALDRRHRAPPLGMLAAVGARLGHLPRRGPAQPGPLLHAHQRRAGARGRRPGDDRPPHRARGRLGQLRPGARRPTCPGWSGPARRSPRC